LFLILVSFVFETSKNAGYPIVFWAALLWLAFIPAAGFSIWYTLLKRPGVKVSELNMWKFIIPVTGCILSWLLLPDVKPDFQSVIGILIITAALLIFQIPIKKQKN
ncbi:MAG: DMT family transporter, partial [Bacteroidales bacterium]